MQALKIDLAKVQSVYSGINGKCCCGCSGKHTYPSAVATKGKEIRGYEIGADEVSDKTVKLIVSKMEKAVELGQAEVEENSDNMACVVVGRRLYIAYFAK